MEKLMFLQNFDSKNFATFGVPANCTQIARNLLPFFELDTELPLFHPHLLKTTSDNDRVFHVETLPIMLIALTVVVIIRAKAFKKYTCNLRIWPIR